MKPTIRIDWRWWAGVYSTDELIPQEYVVEEEEAA